MHMDTHNAGDAMYVQPHVEIVGILYLLLSTCEGPKPSMPIAKCIVKYPGRNGDPKGI
jgi:hypothetical protein